MVSRPSAPAPMQGGDDHRRQHHQITWLMPSMTDRKASGSCTLISSWRGVAPNEIAASRGAIGTSRSPRAVSRIARRHGVDDRGDHAGRPGRC